MTFSITTSPVQAGDRSGMAYILANATNTVRAEVWPTHGFNCLRWQIRTAAGEWDDLLFTSAEWQQNPVPTRSGHPVLFPFPNRLREGKLTHRGKMYQLPLTESSGQHSIHGFTPRIPWRVVDQGVANDHAFVTGEFQLSQDAPEYRHCWPADARLRLTYRLFDAALRVEAVVDAADGQELPFGLGYHPYFRAPGGATDVGDWLLTSHANEIWETDGIFPTGQKQPLPAELDYRKPRPINGTKFDTLFGSLSPLPVAGSQLSEVARIESPGAEKLLRITVDPKFHELLLFIPVHRQAIAIEPYTCTTNAPQLPNAAGWLVLPPGETFRADVEYRLESISSAGAES